MSELIWELISELQKNSLSDKKFFNQKRELYKIYNKINCIIEDYKNSKDPFQIVVLTSFEIIKSRTGTYYVDEMGKLELHNDIKNYLNMMKKLTEIARRSRL